MLNEIALKYSKKKKMFAVSQVIIRVVITFCRFLGKGVVL